MDLIAAIQYLGNKFSGRKTAQEWLRPAKKNNKNKAQPPSQDVRLGQKIDTTA